MKKAHIILFLIFFSITIYTNGMAKAYQVKETVENTKLTPEQDSAANRLKVQHDQKEKDLAEEDDNITRIKLWAVVGACFLLTGVGMLVSNVKRKTRTNAQLTELNAEIFRQKNNLDRINHHLEEIIGERTKDLQDKNKKLSEYSSYLSHQIRGPIATLRGLMNLEREGLIDKQECIDMMDKCVSEIDEKIIVMSHILHGSDKGDP
jgi:hypothetical protein